MYIKNKLVVGFSFVLATTLVILSTLLILNYNVSDESKTTTQPASSAKHIVDNTIKFGVVDPDKLLISKKDIQIEHIFIPWGKQHLENSIKKFNDIPSDRDLLITIEPFKDDDNEDLVKEILSGKYDDTIHSICTTIASYNKNVAIRFAHEMDTKNAKYPWASLEPSSYIAIYQRFIFECKKSLKATYLWSPNGEKNAQNYYPGDDFVDAVGISAHSYPEFEQKIYNKILTFEEMLDRKLANVQQFKKNIWIAEAGIAGSEEYQKAYFADIKIQLKTNPKYTNIKTYIYFYYYNAIPWVAGIQAPDYRFAIQDLTF